MDGKIIRQLLANNMKRARKRLDFTQAELAEIVGVSTSFIGEIEICRKFPSPSNIEGIAMALCLKPHQLFSDEVVESDKQVLLSRMRKELLQVVHGDIDRILLKYIRK